MHCHNSTSVLVQNSPARKQHESENCSSIEKPVKYIDKVFTPAICYKSWLMGKINEATISIQKCRIKCYKISFVDKKKPSKSSQKVGF